MRDDKQQLPVREFIFAAAGGEDVLRDDRQQLPVREVRGGLWPFACAVGGTYGGAGGSATAIGLMPERR